MLITVEQLQKELTHWKANHENITIRCKLLRDRLDLPVERIKAFEHLEALQNENASLHARIEALLNELEQIKALCRNNQAHDNNSFLEK